MRVLGHVRYCAGLISLDRGAAKRENRLRPRRRSNDKIEPYDNNRELESFSIGKLMACSLFHSRLTFLLFPLCFQLSIIASERHLFALAWYGVTGYLQILEFAKHFASPCTHRPWSFPGSSDSRLADPRTPKTASAEPSRKGRDATAKNCSVTQRAQPRRHGGHDGSDNDGAGAERGRWTR